MLNRAAQQAQARKEEQTCRAAEKIKIAVLVSGGGTNLQALLDAEKAGKLKDGEIVLVLSDRADAYALQRAQNAGKKSFCVDRTRFSSGAEREGEMRRILEENGAELLVLAGFLSLLSKEFTCAYEGRIINVHPSLIPSFCGKGFYGLKVHEAALACGVKVTGATVHYVNEIPDGGKIIRQKAVRVRNGDTPQSLQQRVMREAEWIILPAAAQEVCVKLKKQKKRKER